MVQLRILSGKKARATWVARRFPVRVGRSSSCDLQLEEHGVWDQHFQIDFNSAGIVLETGTDALVTTNGQPVQRAVLRNGDTIEVGALKLQFWMDEAVQRGLGLSEWLVWLVIGVVSASQIALIYWLPR